tara:strand:- start:716 stop:970 length:255 start_codon:yes stop_codon:yes gene_type:complete
MTRQSKINRIRSLVNEVIDVKEIAANSSIFYSNGTNNFLDCSHTKQVTKKQMNDLTENSRINQQALNIFQITIIENNGKNTNTL